MSGLAARVFLLESDFPQICAILGFAVKSCAMVLSGWSIAHLLESRSATARCWVWRCVLVGVLGVLPLTFGPEALRHFRLTVPVQIEPQRAQTASGERGVEATSPADGIFGNSHAMDAGAYLPKTPSTSAPPIAFAASLESYLLFGWWFVAVVLLAVSAIRIFLGIAWLKRMSADGGPAMLSICHQVANEFGIRARPVLRVAGQIRSPLVLGLFRPIVYLPPDAASWSPEKLRAVFLHELAHWERRDNVWQYIGKFAAALIWWNPLVALAARRMGAEAEKAADDGVLLHSCGAQAYAAALVEIASASEHEPASVAGLSMIGSRSLEERIRALLVDNPWRGKIGRSTAALLVGLLIGFIAGGSIYFARAAAPADGPVAEASKAVAKATLQVTCVDAAGRTVPNAEVLAEQVVHFEGRVSEWTYLPPARTNTSGRVNVEFPVSMRVGSMMTFRSVYARVAGKLVGVGSQFIERARDPGNPALTVVMGPTYVATGKVAVPPGYDLGNVRVRLLTLMMSPKNGVADESWDAPPKSAAIFGWPDIFSAKPDAEGRVEFCDLPLAGNSYFSATGSGLGEAQAIIFNPSVDPAVARTDFNLSLRDEAVIEGLVAGNQGRPLAGVRMAARVVGGGEMAVTHKYEARTDENGRYRIIGLPPGCRFHVWPEPNAGEVGSVEQTDTLAAGQTLRAVDFKMTNGCVITGQVTESKSGQPVEGVVLWATNSPAKNGSSDGERIAQIVTDREGRFQTCLPPGSNSVTVNDTGNDLLTSRPPAISSRDFTVATTDETISGVDLTLIRMTEADINRKNQPLAAVRLRVVDSEGKPLEGVVIAYHREIDPDHGDDGSTDDHVGQTTTDGTFKFEIRPSKKITVYIGGMRHSSVEVPPFDSRTSREYDLGTFTVARATAKVSGRIVAPGGDPIIGAAVASASEHMKSREIGSMVSTDGSGRFSIPHVLADEPVDLFVRAPGYITTRGRNIAPNTKDVVITMKPLVGHELSRRVTPAR